MNISSNQNQTNSHRSFYEKVPTQKELLEQKKKAEEAKETISDAGFSLDYEMYSYEETEESSFVNKSSKAIREAVNYRDETTVVRFSDFKNQGYVEIAFTNENLERLEQKFDTKFNKSEDGRTYITGEAEKTLATYWNHLVEKNDILNADKNSDGVLSAEEQLDVKSIITPFGERISYRELVKGDKEKEQAFIENGFEGAIDSLFNYIVETDANFDLSVSMEEMLDTGGFQLLSSTGDSIEINYDSLSKAIEHSKEKLYTKLIDTLNSDNIRELNKERPSLKDLLKNVG